MARITRNLARTAKERTRMPAAQQGHSVEAEAQTILQSALGRPHRHETLSSIMRELFGPEHGFELELPPRERDATAPTSE